MELFTHHKLIKVQDGYIVALYLDRQLTEFATEFDNVPTKEKITLEKAMQKYIKDKLPDFKIKTVNIMVGSLLLASLPFVNTGVVAKGVKSNQVSTQNITIYHVKAGDTLSEIANKFNVTIDGLKDLNGLTSDIIYVGQQLKIPEQQKGIYVIKSGDTLFRIANKFNVTLEELRSANNLEGDLINVGDTLYIPNREKIPTINKLPVGIFHVGDKGEKVKEIQKAFNELGYSMSEDGIYGRTTKGVVLDFQSQYQELVNDGVYGPQTKDYLKQALVDDHTIVADPSDPLVVVNKDYSLPADYVPDELVVPDVPFPFNEFHQKKLMRKDAAKALEELFSQAKEDNINLYALSGYRSYQRQENIFAAKAMNRGLATANKFSAKPGESEHQTGLAMDVTSSAVNFGLTQSFGETKEGKWLKENAPKFGFIIRYPEGKEDITGYSYEPWHLRYVGQGSSKTIAYNNITLEEYLGRV